ncbi:hypothetical protein P3T76_000542 [Phytophthora citrophthora]|uniref:Uncharacterized protein n=1 Tax=Phytophthora citrophthora TaxID=4793 RepID=A0AAD9H0E0_9STRA|nr:hypothetical protein P3T76_000542 [Phytophthora citrophthora]
MVTQLATEWGIVKAREVLSVDDTRKPGDLDFNVLVSATRDKDHLFKPNCSQQHVLFYVN